MKRWVGGGLYNKVTLKKVSKIKCSVHFPNTETKHFHQDSEENLTRVGFKMIWKEDL